ncbi:MAG: tetratricopeptide repeat protein [Planctomycetota bacterium]|nr:tetratricopeptide repeat protein [Planctomycetota bacterium]
MSNGQTKQGDQVTEALNRANSEWSRMMREGRSFSGREKNCIFINTGANKLAAGRFADISAVSGLDFPDDGRAVALIDWDHDGDLDLWISNRSAPRLRLMRNDNTTGNHYVMLLLEGNGQSTNRDGIGARVELVLEHPKSGEDPKVAPTHSIRTLRGGEGFLGQSSRWLHFGLGGEQAIREVTVAWPGGAKETFLGVESDGRYRLVQGRGVADPVESPDRKMALTAGQQVPAKRTQVARIPMIDLLSVPDGTFVGFDGRKQQLMDRKGQPMLVTFWSSDCPHCREELSQLSERYGDLQSAGIEVVALSIDELNDPEQGPSKALKLVRENKYPFVVGKATAQMAAAFQILHNLQIAIHRQLPLPSSFLIDEYGRLAVIYKGPASVEQVISDLTHSRGDRAQRFLDAALIPGSSLSHPRVDEIAQKKAVRLSYRFGNDLQQAGRPDLALVQYLDALRLKPDFAEAHYNLGVACRELELIDKALDSFRQATECKPGFAEAHNALGEMLGAKGRLPEAVEQFQKAVELDGDFLLARENLEAARSLMQQGNR